MVGNVRIKAFWCTIDIFDSRVSLSNAISIYWRLEIIVLSLCVKGIFNLQCFLIENVIKI